MLKRYVEIKNTINVGNAIINDNVLIWTGENGPVIRGGEIRGGEIWGGVIKETPLLIQGSKHCLNISKPDHLLIGCREHTLAHWAKNYRKIGLENGYTKNQIKEYGEYIKLFIKKYGVK